MPPSDDTQGLLVEGSSSASHEPSTVMMMVDATPITSESSTPSMETSLQDQLANVFEEKMSPRPELEESPMTATSETSSNCSSQAAIDELQQPSLAKPVQEEVSEAPVEGNESPENAQESAPEESTTEETAICVETPLSLSDTAEIIETTAQQDIGEQQNDAEGDAENAEKDGPLSMIRKGAVAAVGGTMVGVGLVMIPLPTPFGAVIASSGLAVLGTEFKEAKDMNDKLIGGAKRTVQSAREKIVKSIESMEAEEFDADKDGPPTINKTMSLDETGNVITQEAIVEKDAETSNEVVKVAISKSLSMDDADTQEVEPAPQWLHMNPIERQRQERLAREKYRRENQTSFEQAKEKFTKSTGRFLSKNLLPLLKEKKVDGEEAVAVESNDANPDNVVDEATEQTAPAKNDDSDSKGSEQGYVLVQSEDGDSPAEHTEPAATL